MDIADIVAQQSAQALILSPVVIALVGGLKQAKMPSAYAPLAAVVVGVALSLGLHAHWLVGILAGVAAAGLYDLGKTPTPTV